MHRGFFRACILAMAAAAPVAADAECGVHKDFIVRSDATLAPVRPADCATVTQTPPEFTWPPVNGRNLAYTVLLKHPDGRVESRTTAKNWLAWDAALPAGTYSWQLKVSGSERDTSDARRFTIAPEAAAFVVPPAAAMLKRARETPRPRPWPADAPGATGYKVNDMASRTVAWTLALGYDWMHDGLGDAQKATLVRAIRARTQPMYDDMMARISQYPYDSHGNITLNILAAIGLLMAGDLPEADAWVQEALPMAIVWTSPWGWQDGGFANGTAQGFWDAASNLPAWLVYRNAAGVDLAKKDWVRNHIRYFAYFVPPGSPAGVFGDGQELSLPELWARLAKALNAFAPSPLGRWYARRMSGEDASRIELL